MPFVSHRTLIFLKISYLLNKKIKIGFKVKMSYIKEKQMWIFGGEVGKDVSDTHQCETCKKWFPSSEWLKTHQRIYSEDKLHEDEKKDGRLE